MADEIRARFGPEERAGVGEGGAASGEGGRRGRRAGGAGIARDVGRSPVAISGLRQREREREPCTREGNPPVVTGRSWIGGS
jgi:hypothetical protein